MCPGTVRNPNAAIGTKNLAAINGDSEFASSDRLLCTVPVINRGFTLKLDNGGKPCNYSGPISGSGKVEISAWRATAASRRSTARLRTRYEGTWLVQSGRVVPGQAVRRRCPWRNDHRHRVGQRDRPFLERL